MFYGMDYSSQRLHAVVKEPRWTLVLYHPMLALCRFSSRRLKELHLHWRAAQVQHAKKVKITHAPQCGAVPGETVPYSSTAKAGSFPGTARQSRCTAHPINSTCITIISVILC
jgi:hypothetical protein